MRPVLLLLLLALPAAAQAPMTFEELAKRYEASLQRPALVLRTDALDRFAATKDPRALKALLARYGKPDAPEQEVQYLIASALGAAYEDAATQEVADALLAMCKKTKTPEHVWLWYQALRLQAAVSPEPVIAVAGDKKAEAWVRAAAVDGVAAVATDSVVAVVRAALGGDGKTRPRGDALALVVEACATALGQARPKASDEAAAIAYGLVIDALDDKALGPRSHLVVARALGRALDAPELWLDAANWKKYLAARATAGDEPAESGTRMRKLSGPGVSTPRFLGIPAAGVRVVFVLDLSDSMLIPISPAELTGLRRVRTGPDGEEDGVAKLPWDKIKDRFDACREGLIQSLGALNEKNRFAVVIFGQKAEHFLEPRLVPGTKQNVERAVAAVRAIKAGAPAERRPHGTLRGETNLDGGLRLAFRLTEKGPIPAAEHVAQEGFESGADTIFVLSDGAPSWDDFDQEDITVDDWRAGDPETSEDMGVVPRLHYYGPFVLEERLFRDVERLNLLRQVELHTIGFGEASGQLLERLARLGHGQTRWLGRDTR